jgi:CBS domain-containing protein
MAMLTIRQLLQLKGNDIWSITPHATVYDALRMMADKDIGALLVMENDRLVGIISERDYARKITLFGKTSRETLVSEIMTSTVFTIHPDQTIEEVMEMMTNKRIRHVPVVVDDRVLGVISIGDVVKNIIFKQRQVISEMEKYVTK